MSDKHTKEFQVYFNYVTSLGEFLASYEDDPSKLYENVVSSKVFRNLRSGRFNQSDETISKHLRHAWFTEINIRMAGEFDGFVGFSNLWSPIQLYYSLYLTLRAYFLASGENIGEHHSALLNSVAHVIKARPFLFPYPWSVICVDDPKKHIFSNLPVGIEPKIVSSLSSNRNVNFWDRYTMFLQTTHKRSLDDKCKTWKSKNRPRVPKRQREILVSQLHPTTIFDCLYRLRIRSNYLDADTFLLSAQSLDESKQFHKAIVNILWYSQLSLELLIAKLIEKKNFHVLVESFRTPQTNIPLTETIEHRWKIINHLF